MTHRVCVNRQQKIHAEQVGWAGSGQFSQLDRPVRHWLCPKQSAPRRLGSAQRSHAVLGAAAFDLLAVCKSEKSVRTCGALDGSRWPPVCQSMLFAASRGLGGASGAVPHAAIGN